MPGCLSLHLEKCFLTNIKEKLEVCVEFLSAYITKVYLTTCEWGVQLQGKILCKIIHDQPQTVAEFIPGMPQG